MPLVGRRDGADDLSQAMEGNDYSEPWPHRPVKTKAKHLGGN